MMGVMIVNNEILPAGFTSDEFRLVAPSVQHSESISWAGNVKATIPPLATMTAFFAMDSPPSSLGTDGLCDERR
jgi:hypothetical protein